MAEKKTAVAAPLFETDFGANCGVLAPMTLEDLVKWIHAEKSAWYWITFEVEGHAVVGLNSLGRTLEHAASQAVDVRNAQENTPEFRDTIEFRNALDGIQHLLRQVYERGFPHASSALGKRVQAMCERHLHEAVAYLSARLNLSCPRFAPTDIPAWDGFHTGLVERVEQAHEAALKQHNTKMTVLQETFRKDMALRAPVSYWEGQRRLHSTKSKDGGWWVVGAMWVLLALIGGLVIWASNDVTPGTALPTWKTVILGLVGGMGFWAVRLIVRIYLSHRHLANDAAERVTMVQTYLSLHEDGKVLSDDDRKLVLVALFRSASDGFVKDDAVINPLLEAFTKPK
jgi:hypothetical protein